MVPPAGPPYGRFTSSFEALTPVIRPIDRVRFRFKRLFLALASRTLPGLTYQGRNSSETRDNLMPLDSLGKYGMDCAFFKNLKQGAALLPPLKEWVSAPSIG